MELTENKELKNKGGRPELQTKRDTSINVRLTRLERILIEGKAKQAKLSATLLDSQGLRADNMQTIIDDFNLQRKTNAALGKAVGHIALSWSVEDKRRLSSDNMAEVARLYMEQMGISDTQYLIVQHNDRPHPHLHIVYNRVDDFGKTISDQFQKQRNAKVCKDITLTYGYHLRAVRKK